MPNLKPNFGWSERVRFQGRPSYVEILERLEAAISDGELKPGDRLPAQRQLAEKLNVDFTVVTRAYSAARVRGLVEGTVGRGTYVSATPSQRAASVIDLVSNDPPSVPSMPLGGLIADGVKAIEKRVDFHALLSYRGYFARTPNHAASARWLESFLGPVDGVRVLNTPGAQAALTAALCTLCRPGDAIVTDQLAHPGFIWLARQFGWRVLACSADEQGLEPDALARICERESPKALYVVPTCHNPTALTMPLSRRRDLAAVADKAGIWIVEADPFSPFLSEPPPAIASIAPSRTVYLSTLTKIFGAGFRLGHLVAPENELGRIADSLRAIGLGPAALSLAIFEHWVEEGVAQRLIEATRTEVQLRHALARTILPGATGDPEAPHIWLPVGSARDAERIRLVARERGVAVATEESFATDQDCPAGLRLALGAAGTMAELERALRVVSDLNERVPSAARPFVW